VRNHTHKVWLSRLHHREKQSAWACGIVAPACRPASIVVYDSSGCMAAYCSSGSGSRSNICIWISGTSRGVTSTATPAGARAVYIARHYFFKRFELYVKDCLQVWGAVSGYCSCRGWRRRRWLQRSIVTKSSWDRGRPILQTPAQPGAANGVNVDVRVPSLPCARHAM